jgi:hypothetical protein
MRTLEAGWRPLSVLAAVALAIAAMAVSVPATASARSSCDTGFACMWSGEDYAGELTAVDNGGCCGWRYVSESGDTWRSAKNRMTNRKLEIGTAFTTIACLDPGENRPSPGGFDRLKIGVSGSSC